MFAYTFPAGSYREETFGQITCYLGKFRGSCTYRFVESSTRSGVLVVPSKEPTRGRAVRVKGHLVLAQDREEGFFICSHDRIVRSLEDAWLDKPSILADVDKLLNFLGSVVGKAPIFDLPFLNRLVHSFASLFKGRGPVRDVQVLSMNLFDFQGFEGGIDLTQNLFLGVASWLRGHDLCINNEFSPFIGDSDSRLRGGRRVRRVHA